MSIPFLHELQVMYAADRRRLTIEPVTCPCCGDLRRVVDDQGLSFRCPHCTDTVNWCPVCSSGPHHEPTEQGES